MSSSPARRRVSDRCKRATSSKSRSKASAFCATMLPISSAARNQPRRSDEEIRGVSVDSSLRSEEHTSELQSRFDLVCRLLLEKKKYFMVDKAGIIGATHDDTL